jgi:uncharacterized protein (TIGR03790 family)
MTPGNNRGSIFVGSEGILKMKVRAEIIFLLILVCGGTVCALEPEQILIIANGDIAASVQIAQYYCEKRAVPVGNILTLPLGGDLRDEISRDDYEKNLAKPIRRKLSTREFAGKIKCLLTTYGVPVKVGKRDPLKARQDELNQLKQRRQQLKETLERLRQSGAADASKRKEHINRQLTSLQLQIDYIVGNQTDASVDSELSMVLSDNYELYRWQPNKLKKGGLFFSFATLMVCRLDGPGGNIAFGLIDKAMAAERKGLNGVVYIDSGYSETMGVKSLYAEYDKSLRETARMLRQQTAMKVVAESTKELFAPGACPRAAIYCGWYSLKKYVDAFDFIDGAIGYHISSLEAVDLRDPNSTQWCPAMLADGVTATLGAVAEPYLESFPKPQAFFSELLDGRCLVEAYYRTKPFNSWYLLLIGDPLYAPFKKH